MMKTRAILLPSLAFAFGAAIWILVAAHTHFKLEDAYITFRYSANILRGEGFVFNPGERVLGTTTPLQTLILALLAYPFGPSAVPTVAVVIMPVFGLFAGLAMYVALVRRGVSVPAAALGMAMYYASIAAIRTGIGGMETPLALLLMALSLWALIASRPVALGVFCGLSVLCRIDGLIWVGLIFIAALFSMRKTILIQAAAFVLTLLPWIIFATLYFGSPVPNSLLAKGVVRPGTADALLDPGRAIAYARWFISGTGIGTDMRLLPLWAMALVVGAWRVLRDRPRTLGVLVAFPSVYAAMMYFGRAPRYEWYLLPITFVSLAIAAVGLYEIYRVVANRLLRGNAKAVSYVGAVLVMAIAVIYCSQGVPVMLRHLRAAQDNEDGFRRVAGLWLRDNTNPGASVAMEAIGYQGYFSERRVIDIAGLVTPRVVDFKRRARHNGQVFDWILRDFTPDYIVLRSFEVDANKHFNGGPLFLTVEKQSRFRKTYREAARFVAPHPDSAPLVWHVTIYQRVRPSAGGPP